MADESTLVREVTPGEPAEQGQADPRVRERHTKGVRRILAVAALAAAAFALAIVTLSDDARRGCVADAQRDPTYQARLLGPIEVEKSDYELEVTRDGKPVEGAKICASVAMRGMSGMAVSDLADEVRPGIYKVSIILEMSGAWKGNILITEEGKPPASTPLTFNVS